MNYELRTKKGFTLVELLIALMVTSIVLAAVATLAYSLGAINDSSGDTAVKQAQIRFVTLRITELIRQCRLICGLPGGDLALWRADDNNNSQINLNELVYIERGAGKNYLRLCEISSVDNPVTGLGSIDTLASQWWLAYNATVRYMPLIPQCSNVEFRFDRPDLPPTQRKFVSISFNIIEEGSSRQCQVNAALRCRAGNLLNSSGSAIVSDDD